MAVYQFIQTGIPKWFKLFCFVLCFFFFWFDILLFSFKSIRSSLTNSKHAVDLRYSLVDNHLTTSSLSHAVVPLFRRAQSQNSTRHQFENLVMYFDSILLLLKLLFWTRERERRVSHASKFLFLLFLTNIWHPSMST